MTEPTLETAKQIVHDFKSGKRIFELIPLIDSDSVGECQKQIEQVLREAMNRRKKAVKK